MLGVGAIPSCNFSGNPEFLAAMQDHLVSVGYFIPEAEYGDGGTYTCGAAQDYLHCEGTDCTRAWANLLDIQCDDSLTTWSYKPPCEPVRQWEEEAPQTRRLSMIGVGAAAAALVIALITWRNR